MSFSATVYAPKPPMPAWSDEPDRTKAEPQAGPCALFTWVTYAAGGSSRRSDPASKSSSAFRYRSTQHRWNRRRSTLQAALDRADGAEENHRSAAVATADARAQMASEARERRLARRPSSAPRVVCTHNCEPTVVGSHTSSWYEPLMVKPSPGPAADAGLELVGQRWPSARGKQRCWAPGSFAAETATDFAGAMDVADVSDVRRAARRRNRVRANTPTGRGSPPLLDELPPSPSAQPRMVFVPPADKARARLAEVLIPATPVALRPVGPDGTPGRSSPPVESPDSPMAGGSALLKKLQTTPGDQHNTIETGRQGLL